MGSPRDTKERAVAVIKKLVGLIATVDPAPEVRLDQMNPAMISGVGAASMLRLSISEDISRGGCHYDFHGTGRLRLKLDYGSYRSTPRMWPEPKAGWADERLQEIAELFCAGAASKVVAGVQAAEKAAKEARGKAALEALQKKIGPVPGVWLPSYTSGSVMQVGIELEHLPELEAFLTAVKAKSEVK